MGQKQFNKDDKEDDNSSSLNDDKSDNESNENNTNKWKPEIKTLSNEYILKEYPKYFLHCRKCYQTYLFKIFIPDKNINNYYVSYKCSCFQKFQKTSIVEIPKIIANSLE